jgi:molecular chaperone DnaK
MTELIVGIDLGTTNSALAIMKDGVPVIVPIHGQPTMPSCVGVDPSGGIIVGQAARNQLAARPENTVLSVKRLMGEQTTVSLGGKDYRPEDISALILRELKIEAEKELGTPIKKAVITVPAFFNEAQRKATQIAGELAGLEVVRIINEPTAAALAYGANKSEVEKILVYDLGGGTFDVSLVTVQDGVVEVKASTGNTKLGGDDFDALLVKKAIEKFTETGGETITEGSSAAYRLKLALESAKIRLSDAPFSSIREEYLDATHHLEMELAREQYNELILPLVNSTIECVAKCLADAEMRASDIDKITLVGGASRTPLVQSMLENKFRLTPHWEINPDLIVALGAAVQGAIIAGDDVKTILVDISSHTYQTATYMMEYATLACFPLIPKGTPLPTSKSEVFYTMNKGQPLVEISAYQGEASIPAMNQLIGKFLVDQLDKNAPANSEIVIRFQLDLNGMLAVTATEKHTGLEKTVVMDTNDAQSFDIDDARKRLQNLLGLSEAEVEHLDELAKNAEEADDEDDTPGQNTDEVLRTAKDLRKRAQQMLSSNISETDKAEITELLDRISSTISSQDWDNATEATQALADLLFYLED